MGVIVTRTLACPWHPDGYWRGCKRERVVGNRERGLVPKRLALVCLVRGGGGQDNEKLEGSQSGGLLLGT